MDQGLIHIYCGDGKGKTSAATGLAVRAAGCGKKVLFARFLKNEESGELKVLDQIPEIDVIHLERSYGFYSTLSDSEKEEVHRMYHALWSDILNMISEGTYDILVMDEFMAAYGRLVELADYVSEIRKIRHPFDRGIRARRGIEY